jgi:hypothetical protein
MYAIIANSLPGDKSKHTYREPSQIRIAFQWEEVLD